MKRTEKVALIRLLRDLVMADKVIELDEIECYSALAAEHKFTRQEEMEATKITLAESLSTLRGLDSATRQAIVEQCRNMSLSNGFCDRSEALLLTAIRCSLDYDINEISTVLSVPKQVLNIPDSDVLFIESEPDTDVSRQIEAEYWHLFADFRLAGFEFIYVPNVIKHYRESPPQMVEGIVSFISPRLSDDGLRATIDKLLAMTTAEFTQDILCNKLGMNELRNTDPALLIKIGTSYVGDDVYSNYLKLSLEGDVAAFAHQLLDQFASMLSSDIVIISNNMERSDKFMYTGFYKLLLDAHLLRRNVRSRVFINPYSEEIYLPDIDVRLSGLHRKEKALYLLLLARSHDGSAGVSFAAPSTAAAMEAYKQRMARLQAQYARIYEMFGGEGDKAPDLSIAQIRGPMLSLIRRHLSSHADQLYNVADYLPTKDASGHLRLGIEPDLVYVRDYKSGTMVPIREFITYNL